MCRSVRERCSAIAPPSARECYMQLQVVSGCGPNCDLASDVPMHEHPRGQSDNFAWQPSYPALRLPDDDPLLGWPYSMLLDGFTTGRMRVCANNASGHRLDALPYPVCRRDWSGRLTADPGSVECCRGHKSWRASRRRTVGLLCDTRDSHAAGWPMPMPRPGCGWTSTLVCSAAPGSLVGPLLSILPGSSGTARAVTPWGRLPRLRPDTMPTGTVPT